jgi:putative methionine-R-sulfoxide reductase with GAF domain
MAAIVPMSPPVASNRRGRVRQKVHVPAYATLGTASGSDLLDLYEVLDISESGVSLQCPLPFQIDQIIQLCLDFAEAPEPISASARVVWLESGRVGLALAGLAHSATRQLKQWLLLNALSAADLAQADSSPDIPAFVHPQNYTDLLAAAAAVQREAEALGPDLESALFLLASRSRSLLRASGAAIALEAKDPGVLICRATSGGTAPPVGMALEVGNGFSGECVRSGKLLRCDDTENDPRADRQTCRALGIRSMLAAPIRIGERTIGLLEVFSQREHAFTESDSAVLHRFTDAVLAALNRAVRAYYPPAAPPPTPPQNFPPSPGSVLFAHPPQKKDDGAKSSSSQKQRNDAPKNSEPASFVSNKEVSEDPDDKDKDDDKDRVGGIRLPRAHLFLLIAVAATIALTLGFILAPWIQEQLQARHIGEPTVFASTRPPAEPASTALSTPSADSANLAQLLDLAAHGDASAENSLGLLYIAGDDKQGVQPDEKAAVQWFMKAAERGSVPAQSKLGSLYWGGRGIQKDDSRAYFWTVLARANGDDASKVLAPFIAMRLTPPQRTQIEQEAEQWLQTRESAKNSPR